MTGYAYTYLVDEEQKEANMVPFLAKVMMDYKLIVFCIEWLGSFMYLLRISNIPGDRFDNLVSSDTMHLNVRTISLCSDDSKWLMNAFIRLYWNVL